MDHQPHHHLNPAQRDFVMQWLIENANRPKFGDYERASRAIGKIPTAKKPKPKDIPYCATSSEGQVVPTRSFYATRDLTPGWALAPTYDSGNNHRIVNAGVSILADLWNAWAGKGSDAPMVFGPPGSVGLPYERLAIELKANGIKI